MSSGIGNNVAKFLGIFGSTAGAVTDVIDGIGSSVREGKNAIMEEISSSKYEQKLENAKQAILAKHKAIKEIADKLGIPMEDAEKLLDKAMGDD